MALYATSPSSFMRLWSEEKKSGTIEVLLTLPITTLQAVLGKFLAAWCFSGLALLATFPIPLTINYLGNPDNLIIMIGYFGSFLMAGVLSNWVLRFFHYSKSGNCIRFELYYLLPV